MIIERTRNAKRNILWGTIQRTITTVLPFINRTILIYSLGDQYVGLGSLFSSILSVLNLAELGVGSALVFSMYKPIALEDRNTICALMRFYRKCYRLIGSIILILGLMLVPFLPFLIKGGWPADINLYLLYAMYLGETVLSYFLFAYKNCLFDAHQRRDVASKVSIVISIVSMLLQMLILLLLKNYYLFIGISLVATLLSNVAISVLASKEFPDYKCEGELDKETIRDISKKVKGLLSSKIGAVVINSADNIVISSFLGLAILGQYNNYYYIMNTIIVFLNIILASLTAGIGNKVVTDSIDENLSTFKQLTFLYQWIVSWCSACLICLYQPFMKIWNPKGMFSFYIVCLMVFRFFTGRTVQMSFTYKDALGLWWEDRWRPIVVSITNLIVNIILVKTIGIAGVIISTFLTSVFISTPWGNHVLFKYYFKKNEMEYFSSLFLNYVSTFFICAITYIACSFAPQNGFSEIAVKLIICFFLPNLIMVFIYHNKLEYIRGKQRLIKLVRKV